MRFHLTKIIEDRSPVVVTKALERCLKLEAWEIKRHDQQMIALGIGSSRSKVNMSDKAVFEIDYREGATTVQVDVEYEYTWFLSEESQNDAVHSRFESIFANTRLALALAPESPVHPSKAEDTLTPLAESSMPPEPSAPPAHSSSPTNSNANQDSSSHPPQPDLHASTASPPIQQPAKSANRLAFRNASLVAASLIAVLAVALEIAHVKNHPPANIASRPVQTAPSIPTRSPAPKPVPVAPLPAKPVPPVAPSADDSEDLKHWLQQWAASERTRDAKTQASFYADDVRPYLSLDQATRDAVYQDKQNSIQNRQGLWTFKIEHISIQRQTPDEASVLLKKLVMTQTGTLRISEHRISSFLTLKRTPDGWQITGERDLH